jgi:filamentous hemagglutinin
MSASSLPDPVPLTISGIQGVRYTANTPQGNFTLRSVWSFLNQSGAVWTIDVPGGVTGTSYNREIKFLRGGGQ